MHLTQLAREYGDKPAVITGESGESPPARCCAG
jgi:hypothetical protein